MSVLGILDAMRSDLPPATRLVWQCLENHANGHRFWSMAINDIAAELGIHRDTAQQAVLQLERRNIIRIERRKLSPHVFWMLRNYDTPPLTETPTPDPDPSPEIPTLETEMPTLVTEKPLPEIPSAKADSMPEIPSVSADSTPEIPTASANSMTEIPRVVESTSKVQESTRKKESTSKESTSNTRARALGAGKEGPGFSDFYAQYPRKDGGRAAAAKAWQKALTRPGVSAELIIEGLSRYRFAPDPEKVPMCQTWLNQGRWTCEYSNVVGKPRDLDPSRLTGFAAMLYRNRCLQPEPASADDLPLEISHG